VDLVDQETPVDQQHHHSSNTTITVPHTTVHTQHCEQSQLAAPTQITLLVSIKGIITSLLVDGARKLQMVPS
jgi:hypothetical protein